MLSDDGSERADDVAIRWARPDDEASLSRLYESAFLERPDALARWKYSAPPGGDRCWAVMEHHGEVVGQVVYVLFPAFVDGAPVLVGSGADAVVHPDHRGRGGLRRMQAMQKEGPYDLRLAFPTDQVAAMARRERAERVARLPQWVRWVRPQAAGEGQPVVRRAVASVLVAVTRVVAAVAAGFARRRWRVEPAGGIDGRYDRLAADSVRWARAIRRRDAAYVAHRWIDRPDGARVVLEAVGRRGELGGWAVVVMDERVSQRRGHPTGRVVDLLARGPGPTVALLTAAVDHLAGEGAHVVLFDHQDPRRRWSRLACRAAGFLPRGTGVNLVSHHNERFRHVAYVSPGDWYLTFGDTDLC